MSISGSELDQPSTEGEGYGRATLSAINDPERIFPLDTETGSIIIRANPDNAENIYLGFDDTLTTTNGFAMESGDTISIDINVAQQAIWFVGEDANDSVHWMAIN